jgi:hypothetical protein
MQTTFSFGETTFSFAAVGIIVLMIILPWLFRKLFL